MIYSEIIKRMKSGKIAMLPDFIGYFKWDYGINDVIFYNKGFKCKASELDISNRKDFYYII